MAFQIEPWKREGPLQDQDQEILKRKRTKKFKGFYTTYDSDSDRMPLNYSTVQQNLYQLLYPVCCSPIFFVITFSVPNQITGEQERMILCVFFVCLRSQDEECYIKRIYKRGSAYYFFRKINDPNQEYDQETYESLLYRAYEYTLDLRENRIGEYEWMIDCLDWVDTIDLPVEELEMNFRNQTLSLKMQTEGSYPRYEQWDLIELSLQFQQDSTLTISLAGGDYRGTVERFIIGLVDPIRYEQRNPRYDSRFLKLKYHPVSSSN